MLPLWWKQRRSETLDAMHGLVASSARQDV